MTDFFACDKSPKGPTEVRSVICCAIHLFCSRNKLAVVDENNTCLVYNLKNNELLFQVWHNPVSCS